MNTNDVQGYINDVVVENVNAQYTIGLGVALGAPTGEPLSAVVSNVVVRDAFIYGGLNVTFSTPKPPARNPNSQYDVAISNVTVGGSPASPGAIGVEFHRHIPTAGDDFVELQNLTVSGFATPLLIEGGFDGMLLDNVHWSGTAIIDSAVTQVNSGPSSGG